MCPSSENSMSEASSEIRVSVDHQTSELSLYFSWSYITREYTRKSHFPESYISRRVTFPGKLHFLESHISGKSYLTGSHISLEVIFPGKPDFPGSYIFWKSNIFMDVTFLGMSHFLGSQTFWEMHFPGCHNYWEVISLLVPLSNSVFDEGCQNLWIGLRRKTEKHDLLTCGAWRWWPRRR